MLAPVCFPGPKPGTNAISGKQRHSSRCIPKLLFAFALLSAVFLIYPNNANANNAEIKKTYKKIEFDELQRLAKSGKPVEKRIIEGKDIVNLLALKKLGIIIKDATIQGDLDFQKPRDEGGYRKESLAPIEASLRITDTEIEGQVLLRDRIFNGELVVISTVFRGLLDLSNSIFKQKVDFRTCTFKGNVSSSFANFISELDIEDSTFDDFANFSGTYFDGITDFGRSRWRTNCWFKDATFGEKADFEGTVFGGSANFAGTHFKGYLRLAGSAFQQDVLFTGATFENDLDGRGMKCEKTVNFSYATFLGLTTFREARFRQKVIFSPSVFLGELEISSGEYGDTADFSNSSIASLKCMENARFMANAVFHKTTIISTLNFDSTEFNGEVDFSGAIFGPSLDGKSENFPIKFRSLQFKDDVHFSAAEFIASSLFENIKFGSLANFSGVKFNQGLGQKYRFIRFQFKDLRVRWQDMPDPKLWDQGTNLAEAKEPKSEVLRSLESHFRKMDQLSDANDVFYHRMDIELAEQRDAEPFYKWLPSQIFWYFCKGLCGYGTSLWLILFWCIAIDLTFTLIYYKIEPQRLPLAMPQTDSSFKLRLLDFPRHYFANAAVPVTQRKPMEKLWAAFLLSTVLLVKIGYRDTKIREGSLFSRVRFLTYRNIVRLEWGLGYILLAAFVITLSNTFPLVNRLLSGVF